MDAAAADGPVESLRRWEAAGAVWRLLDDGTRGLTVGLFTCDGSEEMSRLTTLDPALREFVAGRDDSSG